VRCEEKKEMKKVKKKKKREKIYVLEVAVQISKSKDGERVIIMTKN
jgi:hypothetical protein